MKQRASDAEREHALTSLQQAFADGRLNEDELRARIERVLHAQTSDDLVAVTRDVPGAPRPVLSPSRKDLHRGRHGEHAGETEGLRPTDERFRDPSTHRVMRVWLNAQGERRYLPD
jgi:hypothetical protein